MPPSLSPAKAWNTHFLRIGHGGASGHARANSLRSLTVALELGVDVVEFDVRPCRDALVLLHDDNLAAFGVQAPLSSRTLAELRGLDNVPDGPIATFADALDLIKGRALINVDIKAEGYEEAAVEMARTKGVLGDILFSSLYPASLQRVKQAAPDARTGLSYPEDRGNASNNPYLAPLVSIVVTWMRLSLSYRILAMMAGARANAVMLYHKVISGQTVGRVHRAGGQVYAWTVDDAYRLRQLQELGVNGIASNHPELFGELS